MYAQEAMEEDAAPLPLPPGRAKADSLAVLLGQALRAGDQALLEKCAPVLCWKAVYGCVSRICAAA